MADITWTGSVDGDLDKAGNWDAGVPASSDLVYIAGAGTTPSTGTCTAIAIFLQRAISGGTYVGTIYGSGVNVSGGNYYGAFYNSNGNEVTGGHFYDYCDLNGPVSNAIFEAAVYCNYGTISSGTFNGGISGGTGATINGGTFDGAVYNNGAWITGGTFNSTVNGAYDVQGGTFYGNATIGQITWGSPVFYGDVEVNSGNVGGGTFNGKYTMAYSYGNTQGGTFNGDFIQNTGYLVGGDFSNCPKATIYNTTWTKAKGVNGSGMLGMI
jgi:hypothetical protein